jgi:segregation and condensation protein A
MNRRVACCSAGDTGSGWRTLGDLLRAFADVMEQAARDRVHHLEPLAVTIEEKVDFIRGRLRRDGRSSFRELFVVGEPRSHWIVTFVALLEMAREGEIRLRQAERFGDINVFVGEEFKK